MDTSLLFVTSFVWWKSNVLQEQILFSLVSTAIILLFFIIANFRNKKKGKRKIPTTHSKIQKLPIPQISDTNFYPSILIVLQEYISFVYMPQNTYAHTLIEVKKYCICAEICELYADIEQYIYSGLPSSDKEKQYIRQAVISLITKNCNNT